MNISVSAPQDSRRQREAEGKNNTSARGYRKRKTITPLPLTWKHTQSHSAQRLMLIKESILLLFCRNKRKKEEV